MRPVRQAANRYLEQCRRLHELSAPDAVDEPNALEHAAELIKQADRVLLHAVALERARDQSWHVIGAALGISRQAAHERFARRLAAVLPTWRALADEGRGDGDDVQSIDAEIEAREQIVAPDRD